MGEDKIAAFYDDPVKTECDAWSAAKAYSFRSVTIDNGLAWQAQRWARFAAGLSEGTLRRVRNRLGAGSGTPTTSEPDPRTESSRNGWSGRRESNPHLQFGNRRSAIELHPREKSSIPAKAGS